MILLAVILALANFGVQAASTLPFIAALGMIAGRRGNGHFCLIGSALLLKLTVALAACGPIFYLGSYLQQMLPFRNTFAQMLAPLMQKAGLPWSASALVWIAGWIASCIALKFTEASERQLAQAGYPVQFIRLPLFFALGSAALFFSSFILINFPFGGLPPDIPWDRILMALWRNATSNYFLALAYAGASALLALIFIRNFLISENLPIATRWLAFWGIAGVVPYSLIRWGYIISSMRAGGAFAHHLEQQTWSLSLLTASALCCALLLWKPKFLTGLAWAAVMLLIARAILPLCFGHFE